MRSTNLFLLFYAFFLSLSLLSSSCSEFFSTALREHKFFLKAILASHNKEVSSLKTNSKKVYPDKLGICCTATNSQCIQFCYTCYFCFDLHSFNLILSLSLHFKFHTVQINHQQSRLVDISKLSSADQQVPGISCLKRGSQKEINLSTNHLRRLMTISMDYFSIFHFSLVS